MCEKTCDDTFIDCLEKCGEDDCYSRCASNWESCNKGKNMIACVYQNYISACPCNEDCPHGCELCDNSACACSVSSNLTFMVYLMVGFYYSI